MNIEEARAQFIPAVEEILDDCRLSDDLVDKDRFQIMMATIWGNAVLDPRAQGSRNLTCLSCTISSTRNLTAC